MWNKLTLEHFEEVFWIELVYFEYQWMNVWTSNPNKKIEGKHRNFLRNCKKYSKKSLSILKYKNILVDNNRDNSLFIKIKIDITFYFMKNDFLQILTNSYNSYKKFPVDQVSIYPWRRIGSYLSKYMYLAYRRRTFSKFR